MRKQRLCILFSVVFIVSLFCICYTPCTFRLGPQLERNSDYSGIENKCLDVVYGNYCVHSLQGVAQSSESGLGSITLCTQGTVGFLQHVSVLCKRWGGPISVAVYSPPLDYSTARATVVTLRQCDFCIRHWVSWHFFYEKSLGDFLSENVDEWLVPGDCDGALQGSLNARRKSNGTYPINVGRNIARKKSLTPYIFSLDIELYPSSGVLPKFERMLQSSTNMAGGDPQVWVLPVFEVYSNESAPDTKFELKRMFERKQAISFHKYRCNKCHMIPNLTQWLNLDADLKSEVDDSLEPLRVWRTVHRSRSIHRQHWEPFFIGTDREPEFDIRLSWEGKRNKMQVAYEMCLRNYSFHIAENAFLVHSPGINVYNKEKEKNRTKHALVNNKWISVIKRDLRKIYGNRTDC